MPTIDLTGRRFGKLVVVAKASPYIHPSTGKNRTTWKAQCDCGRETIAHASNLLRGLTQSCGCGRAEAVKRGLRFRHGQAKPMTTEYRCWASIIHRCTNSNATAYPKYGARGIKVCKQWRDSFEAFFADMGRKPSSKHSIDRINNDGDYEPGNCRWATSSQQALNKRKRKTK